MISAVCSVLPLCAQTQGQTFPPRHSACCPVFTSPHVKHPLLLLTAHCARLSAALRLIYGSTPHHPSLSLPLPRWCNNGGGLLLPSYRGKVEITLTQGLAASVTKAPRTVQIPFPSFVIRNTIRRRRNNVKTIRSSRFFLKKCLFDKCVLCNNYGHFVTLYNYCLLCSVDEGLSSSYNLLKRTLGVPQPRLPAPSLRISLLIITEVNRCGRREYRGRGLEQNPAALFGHIFLAVSNDRPSIYRHLLLDRHTGTRLVMTLGMDWTRWALSAWLAASCPFVLKGCAEWGSDTLPCPCRIFCLWEPDWVSKCIFVLSLQAVSVLLFSQQRMVHEKGADELWFKKTFLLQVGF